MFWGRRFRSGGGGGGGGSSKVVIIVISLVISSIIAMVFVGLFAWPGWLKPKDETAKPGGSGNNGGRLGTEADPKDLDDVKNLDFIEQAEFLIDAYNIGGKGAGKDYNTAYGAACETVNASKQSFQTVCLNAEALSNDERTKENNTEIFLKSPKDCWSNCMREYRSVCENQEWCIYDAWAWVLANIEALQNPEKKIVQAPPPSTLEGVQDYIAEYYNDNFKTLGAAIDGYKNNDVYIGTGSDAAVSFFSSDSGSRMRVNPIKMLIDLYKSSGGGVKGWAIANINLMKPDTTTLNERGDMSQVVASGKLTNVETGDIMYGAKGSRDTNAAGWRVPGAYFTPTDKTKEISHSSWVFINCPKDKKRGVLFADFDGTCERGRAPREEDNNPGNRCPNYNDNWWGKTLEYVPDAGKDSERFGMKLRYDWFANNRGLDGWSGDVKSFSFVTGKFIAWTHGDGKIIGAIRPYKAENKVIYQPSRVKDSTGYNLPSVRDPGGSLHTMEVLMALISTDANSLNLKKSLWYFDNVLSPN